MLPTRDKSFGTLEIQSLVLFKRAGGFLGEGSKCHLYAHLAQEEKGVLCCLATTHLRAAAMLTAAKYLWRTCSLAEPSTIIVNNPLRVTATTQLSTITRKLVAISVPLSGKDIQLGVKKILRQREISAVLSVPLSGKDSQLCTKKNPPTRRNRQLYPCPLVGRILCFALRKFFNTEKPRVIFVPLSGKDSKLCID